ncbi:MAG: CHASE3 domain-containing protein, partial [Verrucomicrobiia bacterium]
MSAIAVISFLSTQRLVDDIEDVASTYQVMGEVGDIRNIVSRMTSSARGYIITGQEEFLEPFWEAREKMNRQISEVGGLTKNKPEQQQRLELIEKLIQEQVT